MDAFYENVVGSKGAAFFAVCRGKVSEKLRVIERRRLCSIALIALTMVTHTHTGR